jgi:hypothetical protein
LVVLATPLREQPLCVSALTILRRTGIVLKRDEPLGIIR